jgi:hypothetical protein
MAASRDFPALAGAMEIGQARPGWDEYVSCVKGRSSGVKSGGTFKAIPLT